MGYDKSYYFSGIQFKDDSTYITNPYLHHVSGSPTVTVVKKQGNDFLVIDEAHTIEQVASNHLGIRVSQGAIKYQLQRLVQGKSKKGLLKTCQASSNAFNLVDESHKEVFDKMWQEANINGLNGHRSVGGYRASMYNALGDDCRLEFQKNAQCSRTVRDQPGDLTSREKINKISDITLIYNY